jgi:hypothetical protein
LGFQKASNVEITFEGSLTLPKLNYLLIIWKISTYDIGLYIQKGDFSIVMVIQMIGKQLAKSVPMCPMCLECHLGKQIMVKLKV